MLEYLDLNTLYRYLITLRKRHERLKEKRDAGRWYTGTGSINKQLSYSMMTSSFWHWYGD